MILTLEFKVMPVAHQSFKIGRNGIKYKPKKIKDYQEHIKHLTKHQLPDDFTMIPAGTPIKINYLHYVFAYLKSMPKYLREEGLQKTTKPDLHDNLNKALLDAFEGLIYEQDQNICEIKNIKKYYSDEDSIRIQFEW
jgi:Holliday junction resolvase RusA-like endonuclease